MLCPSCGAPISNTASFCEHCGRAVPRPDAGDRSGGDRFRGEAPLPEKFQVEDDGYELRITWSWFTPVVFFLVFFCIFWDGFLVVWYGAVLAMSREMGAMAIIFLLFPLIHVAVGVGLTWFVVCSFVNRTVVSARQGLLSIQHGPLWWPGSQTIPTDDLEQLYCQSKFRRSKNGGGSTTYSLHAVTRDNRKKQLLSNLTEEDQALYLEQAIEKHLKIEDRAVAGEIAR